MKLAAADGRVYWAGYSDTASNTWIGSARVDGTDVRQRQLVIGDYVNDLAVSGRFVYIATPERLERVRLGSKRPLRTLRVLATGTQILSVAVGGGRVYWGDGLLNRRREWRGRIFSADLDGRHRFRFGIADLHQPSCLTLVGPYLFWGDYESARIGRVRVDGTGAVVLLEAPGGPVGLAAHGDSLYWALAAEGGTDESDAIGSAALDESFYPVDVNQSFLSLEAFEESPYSLTIG